MGVLRKTVTELTGQLAWAPTLLLATARISAACAVAPVFAERAVPMRLRVAMGAVIALAVVGRFAHPAAAPRGWGELAIGVGGEVLIGMAIGLAARLLFVGVELGAMHIAQQMGIALGEIFDPFRESPGMLRQLYRLLAIVLFLAIGGHRALIGSVLDSFQFVPAGGFTGAQGAVDLLAGMLSAGFLLGLKVAAPVLAAMLLATVALGLLQRTLPQCNTLSIGLPIRSMLGLAVMAASLAAMPGLLETAWNTAAGQIAGAMALLN